jgi:hypothetical protein
VAIPVRQGSSGDPASSRSSRTVRLLPPLVRHVPVQLLVLPQDTIFRQQQGSAGRQVLVRNLEIRHTLKW